MISISSNSHYSKTICQLLNHLCDLCLASCLLHQSHLKLGTLKRHGVLRMIVIINEQVENAF